jgi:excisionase family DNA binding protein
MTRTKPKKRQQAKGADNKNFAVIVPEGARLVGALKTREAADYLGIGRMTLVRLMERGLIRPNRMTRHLLFPITELQRALDEGICE